MKRCGPFPVNPAEQHDPCYFCEQPFAAGDYTTCIPIRPAGSAEARKAAVGAPFDAIIAEAHWDCLRRALQATGTRFCRECLCTDEWACPDCCYWTEKDLCSACDPDPSARIPTARNILGEAL